MSGFYARLRDSRGDDEALQACVEHVVEKLETADDPTHPGMLLGKIQSGKTRAFLGVIARAFDRGYDVAIVLTKGTKTLAGQTVKRIGRDFRAFVDADEVVVFDIMAAPDPLTRSELRRKLVVVAKKQVQNLDRIQALFDEKYPGLKDRRVLIVDDEADLASVRFTRKKGQSDYDQGRIANQMDRLRRTLPRVSFLQVTATPYALYLQPDDYEGSKSAKEVFHPKRPAFTELLPIHDAYVGGDHYFGGHGLDSPNAYLFVEVAETEHDALRSKDGRTIRSDRLWTSENVRVLRRSLIAFLLGVAVRRHQQHQLDQPPKKYAMIIHNDTQKAAHDWQWDTVNRLVQAFEKAAEEDDARLRMLFAEAYADISRSVVANGDPMPAEDDCFGWVKDLLQDGELNVQRVNSDVQLEPLLDAETAELRLRAKANVFIGGSILDRGITVPQLLAFYYGRNPKRMQADTVLQHSRMYGARNLSDLAVTRFYTSRGVFERLSQIHALDVALRTGLENGMEDAGVVFIQTDARRRIVPCAPSRISLSDVVAVKPNDFLLPTGFDTVAGGRLRPAVARIDERLPAACIDTRVFTRVDVEEAVALLAEIAPTLDLDEDTTFEWEAMAGLMRYYAGAHDGGVLLLAETGRRLSRSASGDKSGLSIIGGADIRALIRDPARSAPALLLLRQEGGPGLGWKAGPFWWPVLASPPRAKPCVYATKVAA